MPNPTSVGVVHVSAPLTNLARLYRPLDAGFIADEIVPRLPVVHETDLYYTWSQGEFYGTEVTDLTADRTEPREVDFNASTSSYTAVRRELAWTISQRERQNADNQLRLQEVKQLGVLGRLQLLREMRCAAILNTTATTTVINGESFVGQITSGQTAAKTAFWDGAATTYQQITGDIIKGITGMRQTIGMRPNTIVIPAATAEGLSKSLYYTSTTGPIAQYNGGPDSEPLFTQYPLLPAHILGMRVLVPGNIKNTANEGQTASYSDLWGETVLLAYVTPGPAMENPSLAYTFTAEARQTRTTRDDIRRLDWYAVGETSVEAVVAPSAGWTITDTLT